MDSKKEKILALLEQIIEKAKVEDAEHKKRMIAAHKESHNVGESWMVYHLNILKDVINKA